MVSPVGSETWRLSWNQRYWDWSRWPGKIMGMSTPPNTPQVIFEQATLGQAKKTVSDPSHILYPEYRLMPSGRRYEVPKWRYNRYKFSFIPVSTALLNDSLAEGGRGGRRRRWDTVVPVALDTCCSVYSSYLFIIYYYLLSIPMREVRCVDLWGCTSHWVP